MSAVFILVTLHTAISVSLASAQPQNATTSFLTKDAATDRVGWVSSPPGRSTMNIVWSCLLVLLVCTYKCLHFSIPSFEERAAGWHKMKMKHWDICYWPEWLLIRQYLRKVGWILMIALAPEYGVGLAVMEYLDARRDLKEVKERWPDLEVVLVHAFYARMGGFALEITEAPEAAEVPTNYPDALGAPPVPEAGWDEAFESVVMTGVGPSNGSPNHHPVPRDLL